MNSETETKEPEDVDDDVEESSDEEFTDTVVEFTDTVVMSSADESDDDTDNVGDSSVEINVEQLIADFEKSDKEASARKMAIRRRLEELAELKALEDTFAFDFDDD